MSDAAKPSTGSGFARLAGEAIVHLRGAGIGAFLQGQLTCDTRALTASEGVRGALCNPKGRVLADLRVSLGAPEHALLRLRADIAVDTAATLERYARFSRIACECDDSYRVYGIWGAAGRALLETLGWSPGDRGMSTDAAESGLCVCQGGGRWELLVPAADAAAVEAELARELQPGDEGLWRALELADGFYRIEPPDQGVFTPQALDYDRMGLVSFQKGCYTGQEVVARLHYRGQSKKRLAVLAAPVMLTATRGTPVVDGGGSDAGTVLRCVPYGGGTLIAAELRIDAGGDDLMLEGEPLSVRYRSEAPP